MALRLRKITKEEDTTLEQLLNARKVTAGKLKRAQIIWLASQGLATPEIATQLKVSERMVRNRLHRFNEQGLLGLEEAPRGGSAHDLHPRGSQQYHPDGPLPSPRSGRGLCELDAGSAGRAPAPRQGDPHATQPHQRDLHRAISLRWRHEETWFGERVDPDFAKKRGAIETVYTAPPEDSVTVCLDQMGPVAVKSYPGKQLVDPEAAETKPAGRAKQEIDYGRREKAGYVFGALQPRTGEVFTATYTRRRLGNWIDFLQHLEERIPKGVDRRYAVLDNLSMHRAVDVLLFNLAYPRWEFVFQPTYAAYLNLIEPWWKTLKSLALKGRRFETWREIEEAVQKATAYWNAHKHPYVWGRRRRHQPRRKPGIAHLPKVA